MSRVDRRLFWSLPILSLCLAPVLSGCGSNLVTAMGQVSFDDGTPVQSGSIEFRRVSYGDRYAARIAKDGRFRLKSTDGTIGLPPGEYEIVVVQIVLTEDLAAEDHQHGNTVPRKYADYYTSGLRTKIEAGKTDGLNIVLALD